MARRGKPKVQPAWFLREWMEACGLGGRGAQAEMMRRTGWSKATMSQLYNFEQDFSPTLLREAAEALSVQQYELLMPPEEAMAIRNLRREAIRVVEVSRPLRDASALHEHRSTGTDG